MKRKGSICSFFSPKRKAKEIENEQLSKVDGGDEVEGEREREKDKMEGEREDEDKVEGEREGQQKRDRDRIQGQGDQGQEEVGEHHSDVSKSRCEVPVQPNRESFPKTLQGGARRSFRSDWYKSHPCLEYLQSKDGAYCFACGHFSLPDAPRTVFTSFEGYRNWRKATMKDSGFCSHAQSEGHVNAMFAWTKNKKIMAKNTSLFGLMDKQKKKQVVENQYYIKTLAEILVLTATENIAQRGHRESLDSEKKGVFLSMLDLLGNHNPIIKKRLDQQAKNAKYTSKAIQNEILECLAAMVKEEIRKSRRLKRASSFQLLLMKLKMFRKKSKCHLF
ncbi:hypothetical protein ABVT39_009419 [Epinephelus coioides]